MPVCVAKTQYSLSDDMTKLGRPTGLKITIKEVRVSAGAGFIVALAGDILTMPGLPKVPAANNIDIADDGEITGCFNDKVQPKSAEQTAALGEKK